MNVGSARSARLPRSHRGPCSSVTNRPMWGSSWKPLIPPRLPDRAKASEWPPESVTSKVPAVSGGWARAGTARTSMRTASSPDPSRARARGARLLDRVRPVPYSEGVMGLFGGRSSSGVTEDTVLKALRAVRDPESGQDIVSLGLVKGLVVEGRRVGFTLEFTTQPPLAKVEIHSQARKIVAALPGVSEAKVAMAASKPRSAAQPTHAHQPAAGGGKAELIPDVKHTIAVSSGK